MYNVNLSQFKMMFSGIVFIFLILKNLSVAIGYVICLEDVTSCKPICLAVGKMGCLTCTCRADIAQDNYDVQWQQSERLEHEELPNPFRMDSQPLEQSHFPVQWQQSEPLEHDKLPNLFRMDSQPPEQSHFPVQWQQSEPLERGKLPNLFRMDSQPPEQSHFPVQWQQSEPLEHQDLPNLFRMDGQPPELSHFRADFNPAFAYHSPNLSPPNNGPVNPYRNYGIFKRSIDNVKHGFPCIQNFPGYCPKSCLTTDYNGCIVCNCTETKANGNNNNGSSQRNFYAGVSGNGLNIRLKLKPGIMGKSADISDPNVANGSGMFSVLDQMLASGPSQNPSNPSNFGNMGVVDVALVFNPTNALNLNSAMSAPVILEESFLLTWRQIFVRKKLANVRNITTIKSQFLSESGSYSIHIRREQNVQRVGPKSIRSELAYVAF